MVFHPAFPVRPQKVEPEAILVRLIDFKKFMFDFYPLLGFHKALKDRILYSLAIVLAYPSDMTKTSRPTSRCGVHIICYQNHHGFDHPPGTILNFQNIKIFISI
jgi:hypothetical protein